MYRISNASESGGFLGKSGDWRGALKYLLPTREAAHHNDLLETSDYISVTFRKDM
jgi:hypothetical protein